MCVRSASSSRLLIRIGTTSSQGSSGHSTKNLFGSGAVTPLLPIRILVDRHFVEAGKPGRGHTLDFTLRSRRDGRIFAAEMKCEITYENYHSMTLRSRSQLDRHARDSGEVAEVPCRRQRPQVVPCHGRWANHQSGRGDLDLGRLRSGGTERERSSGGHRHSGGSLTRRDHRDAR